MNPGRLLEHPIPETTNRSLGSISRFATAWMSALSTPKSPQPGHQSGRVSLLYFDNSIIFMQPPFSLCSQFQRHRSVLRHISEIFPLLQIPFRRGLASPSVPCNCTPHLGVSSHSGATDPPNLL